MRTTATIILAGMLLLLVALGCEEEADYEGEGGVLDSPTGVAVHWPYAYVTNANFDLSHDKEGWISVIDLRIALVRRDQAIVGKVVTKPFLGKIVLTADGSTAYVSDRRNDSIRVIDLSDPIRPVEVDNDSGKSGVQGIGVARQPYGLALSPDETKLYVACMNSGHVSIVDLVNRRLSKNVLLSGGVNEVRFDPTGRYVYVTNRKLNTITMLDGSSGNYVTSFGAQNVQSYTGYDLRGLDFTPDGQTLFVAAKQPSSLLMIDTGKLPLYPEKAVWRALPLNAGPMGVAVTPDGLEVWVTNYDGNTLHVFDAETGDMLLSLKTGNGPTDIQIFENPDIPGYYYALVTNFLNHNLTLYDVTTKEAVWGIP